MDKKKIIIIGGGIAGLSAGVFACKNGFETEIFEMHTVPGGLCTGWKRGEYYFDYCIHWLVGTGSGNHMNRMWKSLGGLTDQPITNHEIFITIFDETGKKFTLYTDADRLEKYLSELAPEDEALIKQMCSDVKTVAALDLPVKSQKMMTLRELAGIGPSLKPFLGVRSRYKDKNMEEFASEFKNPFLKKMLFSVFSLDDFPALSFIMTMGFLHSKNAGWPQGGALPFALRMGEQFKQLGGQLHLGKKVKKIIVKKNRAEGIILDDGSEHYGDYIISAADGKATLYDFLDGKYTTKDLEKIYSFETPLKLFPPITQISLGVNMDLSGYPHFVHYSLPAPLSIGSTEIKSLGFKHYCYDKTVAPEGKSVLICIIPGNYDQWKNIGADSRKYKEEKDKIKRDILSALENFIPGIGGKTETIDIATPLTLERYTGNWNASYEGWLPSTSFGLGKSLPKTLPGLKNFRMIGQWTSPGGGLPPAGMDGYNVILGICKKENKQFIE